MSKRSNLPWYAAGAVLLLLILFPLLKGTGNTGQDAPTPAKAEVPAPLTGLKSGPPAMTFTERVHDFGSVSDVDSHTAVFEFTNTGGSALKILELTSGCACTIPELEKWEYAPGETGLLETVFSPTKGGPQQYTVTIETNAKPEGTVQLHIKAEVESFVTISPKYIKFGELEIARHKEHIIRITATSPDRNWEIDRLETNHPNLSARVVERNQNTGATDIEVVLDREAPWGPMNNRAVTFVGRGHLPDGRAVEKEARVRVLAVVVDDFRADPTMILAAGFLEPGQSFRKETVFSHRAGKPFEIISAVVSETSMADMLIEVEEVEAGAGNSYRLILTGSAKEREGYIASSVILRTRIRGSDRAEIREMPITGRIVQPE